MTRIAPIDALGNGFLYRAVVSLPQNMTERDRPLQERIVFFEVLGSKSDLGTHLEKLLASAWCIDTNGWCESGYIYNIHSVQDMYQYAFGDETTGELRVFETGCGGEDGVGHNRIHYARAGDVDLFVTPRMAARLHELLDMIDTLYASAKAARHEAKGGA